MTTAIGLFRLDCFDKNKKEKKKEQFGALWLVGKGTSPCLDATPGVKIQHPTFPEQIFNRGKHSILAQ